MATVLGSGSRDYCIHEGELPGAGVRRCAVGRLDDAIERLHGMAEDPDQTVHAIRKDIKRARSALRLVRGGIGPYAFERENALLRAAGRLLGPARDSQVKIETLEAERGNLESEASAENLRAWREELRRERSRQLVILLDERAYEIAEILETTRAGVCDWPVRDIDWDIVAEGRRHIDRACRRRLDRVRDDASPARVHSWRRRAKDERHQIELMGEIDAELTSERRERAHRLTDVLGDHNNLAVLVADAATRESVLGRQGTEAVREALTGRMASLLAEALELASP